MARSALASPSAVGSPTALDNHARLSPWPVILIFAAVFGAYAATLHHGFVWDDDAHLTPPPLRSAAGLARIWTEPDATQQYYPLLHTAFWLEHRLWGDAPLAYHLTNVALHAFAAALFFLLLRRLSIAGAWAGALLFALHPIQVESVAWISEQKNTLSLVFYLAAALVFLKWHDRPARDQHTLYRSPLPNSSAALSPSASKVHPSRSLYYLSLALFVCALLTKTVTATLPAALLVLLWWRQGALSWRRDIAPLMPWLLAGLLLGLFTVQIERTLIGAEGSTYVLSALQRTLLAGRVLWFYLGKLLWPANLAFIYPRWNVDPAAIWQWLPLIAWLSLGAALWHVRARSRTPLAVYLLFTGSLFPALGFFNVYPFRYSFVADHFQYLASLAVFAAVGAALARLAVLPPRASGLSGTDLPPRNSRVSGTGLPTRESELSGTGLPTRESNAPAIRNVRARFNETPRATLLGLAATLPLALLTWHQSLEYRDNPTLFRATIATNPACWMAYNNLGQELMADPSRRPEAIALFEHALALQPDYFEAQNNLGLILTQSHRAAEALPHLEAAVRLNPTSFQAHNNLGIAYGSAGRGQDALHEFRLAAALNPALPNLQENWARALLLLGRPTEAEQHFALARRMRETAASQSSAPYPASK